ncbi:phosphotransferase family protein [Spiroplasma endosymbiont of Othius punctulatus]|uniref:phosphotransferase family protein n=1 Tax=Spiroplasma endosymbiont of Othius punctulatus TaxID=3066289 RepID=UPI0030D3E59F
MMDGFTNKVELINEVVKKTSKKLTSVYLNKQNEFVFLKELTKIDSPIFVKPIDFSFENEIMTSTFPFLKSYKDISHFKIDKNIVELVSDGIKSIREVEIKNLELFNHLNYLQWFINHIKEPLFPIDLDLNIFVELDELEYILSHNDLVPGNILFNGLDDIKLIDYDFVSYNNIYFDVASFICETLNDDEDLIKYFINISIKKGLIKEKRILNLEIKYQDILWSLWANYMFEVTGDKIFQSICFDKKERLNNRLVY